ncbi:hypothetical protein JCM11251_001927 [Rhodosporidiobolus azoricus]
MPHISLPGSVQLYYELHRSASASSSTDSPSPNGAPSAKPVLLLLAPSMLDVTFLEPYVETFKNDYDICCLELRSHGRSRNPATAGVDFWVLAADVAHAVEALHLAPCHVYGAGSLAFQVALKLAILFPSLVLSLTLAGAPTLFAEPRNVEAFVEINEPWVRPADEEEWIDVIGGIGEFLLGERKFDGADEAWDRVLPPIVRRYNPYAARHIFMICSPSQRSPGLSPEILATVKQPILLFHGDNDFCFGIEEIQEQTKHFSSAKELEFHAIEGGPHLLGVTHTSAVIAPMIPFLRRHSPSSRPSYAPLDNLSALRLASTISNDPKVALRNPHKPDSFSFHTQAEKEESQRQLDGNEAVEKECELVLPMCHEKNDWEVPYKPGAEGDDRWTWSKRETYLTPHSPAAHSRSSISNQGSVTLGPDIRPLSTFSLADSVTVQVESTEQTTSSPHLQPLPVRNGAESNLEGIPEATPRPEEGLVINGATVGSVAVSP